MKNKFNLDEDRIVSVLEPLRKKQNILLTIGIVGCTFFILLGVAWCFIFQDADNPNILIFSAFIIILGFAVLCVFGWRYSIAHKEYRNIYKGMVSSRILKACFEDAKYTKDKGYTEEEFRRTNIIQWMDRFVYRSEDLISGHHEGVYFKQSDINIYHETGKRDNREMVTDLNGRMLGFEFAKDIEGQILVVKNYPMVVKVPVGLERVQMEDVDFNKKYKVYAMDPHSVFYLLTPHFMTYLKKIYEKDQSVFASFDGRHIYILYSGSGGIFEPPIRKMNIKDEIEKNYNQIHEIVELIDIFHLDEEKQNNLI